MNPSFNQELVRAYDIAADGYSVDRVIADPQKNTRFLAECRVKNLSGSDSELNHALMNLRKRGGLAGKPPSKRTIFKNQHEYRFASEMTARFLERRDETSLDTILCDPISAAEFDDLCEQISPGYQLLEYRWAALGLRKAQKLSPEILSRVAPPTSVETLKVDGINIKSLPTTQGLYLFYETKELLYVGETENLRSRLKKHLDHSDSKGLAQWLWKEGTENLHIEIQTLPPGISTKVRRALELEIIRSREPIFNIQR